MTLKIPKKTFDEPITIDIIENFTNLIKPDLRNIKVVIFYYNVLFGMVNKNRTYIG